MNDQQLTLTLTVDQTNVVLEALAQQPYGVVFEIVAAIQSQANEQLEQSQLDD